MRIVENNTIVENYIRLPRAFINENDSLLKAVSLIRKYNLKKIIVIKDDYSVIGSISEASVKKLVKEKSGLYIRTSKIKNLNIKYDSPILIYPQTGINDAYSIMKCFNMNCLAVVDAPWEKKIIGFLWLDDVFCAIKNKCFKVPVVSSL